MNFPLKNLEFYIDEHLFVLGEKKLEEGKVLQLIEAEKHLWVAEVEECEVEVQISPSKVTACTCDCSTFLEEGMCGHIVSTLLLLRKTLSEKKTAQKKRRKTKRIPKKLTTAVVLDQIPHDELMAFVQNYAKTNRNFSIALKTHFASAVTLNDNKDKYFQILETTLSASRKQDRSIGVRGVKKIAGVLEEILAQAEDEMARDFFAETLTILQAVVEKITPILSKVQDEQGLLKEKVEEAFDLMLQILEQALAPDLKMEIWEYCLEESRRPTYWRNKLVSFFHQMLLRLADNNKRKKRLIAYTDELLNANGKFKNHKTLLVLLKLHLLEQTNQLKKASQLVKAYLNEPDILLHATQQALKKKNHQRVKYLAQEGLQLFRSKNLQNQLAMILLQVAQREQDLEALEKYAHQLLLSTLKIKYFKLLKKNIPTKSWVSYLKQLLLDLEKLSYSLPKRDLIAGIYVEEKAWAKLLEYIRSLQSLDLLRTYAPLLLRPYKKEVYYLYETFLIAYLKNYIGRKTAQKVRDIIIQLNELGARDLADRLVDLCREKYNERHLLMEELAWF